MRIQAIVGEVIDNGEVKQLPTKVHIYRARIRTDPGGDWIWIFTSGNLARTLCMNLTKGMWIAAAGCLRHWRNKRTGGRTEYLDCFQIQLLTRYIDTDVDRAMSEADAIAEVMRE